MAGPNPDAVSRDEFHKWVGDCITAWSQVEDTLFQFCWRSLNCEAELAAIVYFRIPGVDSRLSLVDELVTAILPRREKAAGGHDHPMVKTWKAMIKDARGLLGVRRRLAHQPVRMIPYSFDLPLTCNDAVGQPLTRVVYGAMHFTHTSDAERLRDADSKPLYLTELKKHRQELERVNNALGMYLLEPFMLHLAKRFEGTPLSEAT